MAKFLQECHYLEVVAVAVAVVEAVAKAVAATAVADV